MMNIGKQDNSLCSGTRTNCVTHAELGLAYGIVGIVVRDRLRSICSELDTIVSSE